MRLRNIVILLSVLLVAGGVYYFLSIPKPPKPEDPKYYAWLIDMDSIQHIDISLPREGKSESFIKISANDTFPWYFDDAQHSKVDTQRWGGGIPLLLSGPGVNRIISRDSTPEQLDLFGISNPQMEIDLLLTDNTTMSIKVGDRTPDGGSYYVLAPRTNNDVALVDYSWYDVLSKIVTNPPYATPPAASSNTTTATTP